MSAIRLARGFTGRENIVKFNGCYHGHSDSLLIKAGSGALTLGVPSSPGVPAALAAHTITLEFNDTAAVNALFDAQGASLACVIVEPIAGNMNFVAPDRSFLKTLRERCDEHNVVLIFDEVMTGFRVAKGGAQAHFDIAPDLTTLGKIIGGGMPAAAFGGRRDIMEFIAPLGPVYQAGTLSGNPLAMAAGLATLDGLAEEGLYEALAATTTRLAVGMSDAAAEAGIELATASLGGMFGFVFGRSAPPTCFDDVAGADTDAFKRFFHLMLERGVYLAPSAFEAGFVSTCHTAADIDATLAAAADAFRELAAAG